MQLNQLSDLEARFSTTHMEICHVQQRIKALENAVQMTREVQRVPFLEQYCCLDKVFNGILLYMQEICFTVTTLCSARESC